MVRGLFTNSNVRNLLDPGLRLAPPCTPPPRSGCRSGAPPSATRAENLPLVMVAGERYGMGSSRDWAAKGVAFLGVRAVLALSFERIHRSNLIGMGILPLRLPPEWPPSRLALASGDTIEIDARAERLAPRAPVKVQIARARGGQERFEACAAVETSLEIATLEAGGILPIVLERTLAASQPGGRSI